MGCNESHLHTHIMYTLNKINYHIIDSKIHRINWAQCYTVQYTLMIHVAFFHAQSWRYFYIYYAGCRYFFIPNTESDVMKSFAILLIAAQQVS